MKMKELTMKWIKSQKNYIKESSLYMYKFIVEKHINPSIGEIELKNINQTKIQNMINQKASSGNLKTGGPLSEKTILELIRIILQIINYGEKLRLMNGNNIRVKFPKNIIERSVIDVFGDKELFMLYKHILKEISHLNVGILISMYTGIRIGELCALKWKDINIDEGNLIINKTIQKIYLGKYGSKITITSPKSRKAKRVIPLNLKLVSILKMLENTGEYFLTNSSKPMIPSNYRNYYYKVLKLNNIEKKTFHTLRHTFATKCLNLGTDYKVVSELLGHASVKTTIDIYHHISDENKKKCIEKIEFD